MPNVSIIIPAYNKAELTCLTVDSALAQTYADCEVIVVDDGSTDQTREVLGRYGSKIRYIHKSNGGACSSRNVGIRQSKGMYLAFLDCDDIFEPRKIEASIAYLERNPGYGMVHTAASFIDRQGSIVGHYDHRRSRKTGWISQRLILGNFICNSTVVVRRDVLNKVGFFDEEIFSPADWDMWLRLADIAQVGYISDPLTGYRISDSYILGHLEDALKEECIVVEKFFLHKKSKQYLYRRALSNVHFRFAASFLVAGQQPRFHQELGAALRIDPLSWKAWGLATGRLLFPAYTHDQLRHRILRLE